MIHKRIESITAADIQALLDAQQAESKNIEYKRELPGTNDEAKKEFLADVSSLANTAGGYIIYGIEEDKGVPITICGVTTANNDAEMLKLESSVRDGIEPRIPGVQSAWISGIQGSKSVLVIYIPRSWSAPHMVKYNRSSKFFARTSNGKYRMDVAEIRSAFLGSEELPARVRRFRDERLSKIFSNQSYVPLMQGQGGAKVSRAIMHLIPIEAITIISQISTDDLEFYGRQLTTLKDGGNGNVMRFTFDGFITHGNIMQSPRGYCHLFRNGILETVHVIAEQYTNSFRIRQDYEVEIVDNILYGGDILRRLGLQAPIFLQLTLVGLHGAKMELQTGWTHHSFEVESPITDEVLLLPEVFIDNYEMVQSENKIANLMRSSFDTVWNATGIRQSLNYLDDGCWRPSMTRSEKCI